MSTTTSRTSKIAATQATHSSGNKTIGVLTFSWYVDETAQLVLIAVSLFGSPVNIGYLDPTHKTMSLNGKYGMPGVQITVAGAVTLDTVKKNVTVDVSVSSDDINSQWQGILFTY